MNPMQILMSFFSRGGNPQDLVLRAISGNNNNPMINSLISMAKSGDSKGVENFARNIFKEKGRDFDREYADFISNFNKR